MVNGKIGLSFALVLTVAGCASKSADVAPSYVSPIQYQHYSCDQLFQEGQRVSAYAAQAAGQQDQNRTNDAVMTGIALVVFWPALFAIEGNSAQTAELARLKGEMQAIQQASIQKKCGIQFQQQ